MLLKLVKSERQEIGIFVNALFAIVAAEGENNLQWCDVCFPQQDDGSRISSRYAEEVTGRTLEQLVDSIGKQNSQTRIQ